MYILYFLTLLIIILYIVPSVSCPIAYQNSSSLDSSALFNLCQLIVFVMPLNGGLVL